MGIILGLLFWHLSRGQLATVRRQYYCLHGGRWCSCHNIPISMDSPSPQEEGQAQPAAGSPSDFLKNIVGKKVKVRIGSGIDYHGECSIHPGLEATLGSSVLCQKDMRKAQFWSESEGLLRYAYGLVTPVAGMMQLGANKRQSGLRSHATSIIIDPPTSQHGTDMQAC